MKKVIFLIAIFTSVLLISCADVPNNPSEDLYKNHNDEAYVFPYEYLQRFEERKVIDWNLPTLDGEKNILTVNLTTSAEEIEDLFIIVKSGDPVTDVEPQLHLFFVDHSMARQNMINIPTDIEDQIMEVRAFVMEKVVETDEPAPYPHAQVFRKGYNTWEMRGSDLVIATNPFTPDVLEVFAYVEKTGQDELVYLQLPNPDERIIIPDYKEDNIIDVKLFILSDPFLQ
jgi:hypothetical protein